MTIFSLSLQYFTLLFLGIYFSRVRVPGGGGGEFGPLPVLFFGRPIQNTRHFLLESFVWEEAIHVTILWSEDSVA